MALRQKAEYKLKSRSLPMPEDIAALSPEQIQEIIHELRVHQIELEIQNEELRAAQAELEESRSRYFDLYDMAPVGYCTLSEQGLIRKANLTAATLLGAVRSALVKQPISRFIFKEDQDIYYLHRKQLFETGEPRECELRMVKSDGVFFWAHLKGTAAQAEDGAPVCRVVLSDITNRKREEEALERYKNIVSSTTDAIAYLDENYRYILANNAYEDFSGVNLDDFIGMTVAEYLGKELFEEKIKPNLDKCLNGEIVNYQQWFEYPTKGKRFVDVTYFPYRDGENHISGVIANTRDITERNQAEKDLERVRYSIENLTESVLWVGEEGSFIDFNNTSCERLGYSREEMIKMYVSDIDPHFSQERWPTHWEEMKNQGKLILETVHRTKNNQLIPMELSIHHQKFGDSRYNCVLGRDISERKRTEEERKKLQAQLTQAQKMESIGSLAGGIAHDFNNILFPIVGLSEMMLDDFPPGSPEHHNLYEIFKAGKRGREVVQQILSFSRQSEHHLIPVHIQKVLKEVLKLCRVTIPADIAITTDIQTDCAPVMADPTQIHQITMNLITNAYHAVESTGETITVQLKETDFIDEDDPAVHLASGRYAVLSVSDTGTGIDPAVMDKIFDPYFTTKENGRGTGLGLATVYGIIKAHGGNISVYSERGKGSSFHVYLPVREKSADVAPEKQHQDIPTGTEHILLVDDEAPIVHLQKQMLERLGYRITSFTSSVDALKAFRTDPSCFDLIITDMNMPNTNGMQLAEELTAIRSGIPVIICTGFSERINREKSDAIGINGFLMKPVAKSEIAEMVRNVLDQTKYSTQP